MFTPVESALGALLIHFATTSFLAETGKTIGFSSTIYRAVFRPSVYACSIVTGVLLSTVFASRFLPSFTPQYPKYSILAYALGGMFTGAGTSLGSGCTSGHMLSGLSLLRVRSTVATAVFCAAAAFVVNFWDLAPLCNGPCYQYDTELTMFQEYKRELMAVVIGSYVSSFILLPLLGTKGAVRAVAGLNAGFVFGLGLLISGMASPAKPMGFLSFMHIEKFDPSLAMIILFAILPNIVRWKHYLATHSRPMLELSYDLPTSTAIPIKMLLGNAMFGIGWGCLGICPGPGLIGAVLNGPSGLIWISAFLASYKVAAFLA